MPWTGNHSQNIRQNSSEVDFKKIATVFIICALVSLATAWFYSFNKEFTAKATFSPENNAIIGPIYTKKHKETYNISILANIPLQSWSFIEGEVLDSSKEYLFSFGKELWRESGYDSEGPWQENNNSYDVNITLPKVGIYYLNFKTENAQKLKSFSVIVNKKNGSSLPHLWFGIFTLIIGIILHEKRNIEV
ncbi:hypothetical protein N9C35_02265 [Flavobacteriaceae bacterium]|nr:hypothetical protein [Flavobacteriaceae bacterium]